MNTASGPEAEAAGTRSRAEARGRAVAWIVFVAFAAAFIGTSTWEIVGAVFSRGGMQAEPACVDAVRTYVAAAAAFEGGDVPEQRLRDACRSPSDLDLEALTLRVVRASRAATRRLAKASPDGVLPR